MALSNWWPKVVADKELVAKAVQHLQALKAVSASKKYETAEQTKKMISKILFR